MQEVLERLEKDYNIVWKSVRFDEIFTINPSKKIFHAANLTFNGKYRYITRGETNNGIRGYINEDKKYLNPANTISFGQDTATMFYQDEPYFTGNNIKIISLKDGHFISKNIAHFMSTIMKKGFSNFSWGCSFAIPTLSKTNISLPIQSDGTPHYEFMEKFVATLEEERVATLQAYLLATGLSDYTLTQEEQETLNNLHSLTWKEFRLTELFTIKNTHSILSREVMTNSGKIPYLTATSYNNSVRTYIEYDKRKIDKGNSIFIGGKTFVVTYQERDYFSNDSHNLALYYKEKSKRNKYFYLFMASIIQNSLSHLYSWGDSISFKKIQKNSISLPVQSDGTPHYEFMESFTSAMQKVTIKNVIDYLDLKLDKTKEITNKNS